MSGFASQGAVSSVETDEAALNPKASIRTLEASKPATTSLGSGGKFCTV